MRPNRAASSDALPVRRPALVLELPDGILGLSETYAASEVVGLGEWNALVADDIAVRGAG